MAIFKGAGVAIITPMKENLEVNYDKLDEILEEQIAGETGICMAGYLAALVLMLLVVSLFYGSAIYTYLQPKSSYSESKGKFVALFYTIVTPMLNPQIYTLRNKDVKGALWKVLGRGTD